MVKMFVFLRMDKLEVEKHTPCKEELQKAVLESFPEAFERFFIISKKQKGINGNISYLHNVLRYITTKFEIF